jgi:glycosyltransferase involved in cell wall biosynthesis
VTPSVSVVMPAYNYGRFIGEAVDSVLAQTYRGGVEVIVVDDGSTDDTADRLAVYGTRIRSVRKDNGGVSSARNAGLRLASGEWIGLLDADDLWHPQLLEVLLGVATRGRHDVVCSRMVYDRADLKRPLPADPPLREIQVEDLLTGSPMSSSGTIVRRAAFEAIGGYDERLHAAEDKLLWLQMAARYRVCVAECSAHWYRQHPAQANRRATRGLHHYAMMLDEFFARQPGYAALRPTAESFMYWDATTAYLDEGDRREALRCLLRSLRLRPWVPGDGRFSSKKRLKVLARLAMGERLFRRLKGAS